MPRVLVCCAVPLDSDRQGAVVGSNRPDEQLVFVSDHCLDRLTERLIEIGIDVEHLHERYVSEDSLRNRLQQRPPDMVVVYGHGASPNPIVLNRRKPPQEILVSDGIVTAVSQPFLVWASYSYTYFHTHVKATCIPHFYGFEDSLQAPTSAVNDTTEAFFSAEEQQTLRDLYRETFETAVVLIVEQVAQGNQDARVIARACQRQMLQASMTCAGLAQRLRNNHFQSHVEALYDNAMALTGKCYYQPRVT